MNKSILCLRVSYWIAAIADFAIAILVLIPVRMGLAEVVYPMGLMSAVAISWSLMLVLADRKPMERRWVLIPTIVVVTLLTVTRVVFTFKGAIALSWGLVLFGASLVFYMAFSYWYAGKVHATAER